MNCINPRQNLIKVQSNSNLSCLIWVPLAYSLQITCQSLGDRRGSRSPGSAGRSPSRPVHLGPAAAKTGVGRTRVQSDNHLIYSHSTRSSPPILQLTSLAFLSLHQPPNNFTAAAKAAAAKATCIGKKQKQHLRNSSCKFFRKNKSQDSIPQRQISFDQA